MGFRSANVGGRAALVEGGPGAECPSAGTGSGKVAAYQRALLPLPPRLDDVAIAGFGQPYLRRVVKVDPVHGRAGRIDLAPGGGGATIELVALSPCRPESDTSQARLLVSGEVTRSLHE